MTGSIRKRSKNSWSLTIFLGKGPATGKKKYKWRTVQGTRKKADTELNRLLYELNTGTFVEPSKSTLAEFLAQWLVFIRMKVAAKTYERYRDIVERSLIPSLGSSKLSELRPLHIQNYYSWALKNGRVNGEGGLSMQTVLHHHRVLREALGRAVKWGMIPRSPVESVEPPKPHEKRPCSTRRPAPACISHFFSR